MKIKTFLFLLFVLSSGKASAQDIIVKTDGNTVFAKVLEVNSNDIKYKKHSNLSGPTYSIIKSKVLAINYENGDRDVFSVPNQDSEAKAIEQKSDHFKIGTFSMKDSVMNSSVLAEWENAALPTYNCTQKDKTANILYCVLRPTSDSFIADQNIEISFKGSPLKKDGGKNYVGSNIILTVKNKTTQTVYIDLGNTFIVRGNYSEPYYIPTATSSTQGTQTGVGVNVGAVAGVFGIGGTLGQLANGINVGQGSSQYTTTTVYSQRVIAIPPMAQKELEPKTIIPIEGNEYGTVLIMKGIRRHRESKHTAPHIENIESPVRIGESQLYKEGDLPLNVSTILTYSFDENIQDPRALYTKYFIRQITGIPNYMGSYFEAMPKNFTAQQLNDLFVILWYDKK